MSEYVCTFAPWSVGSQGYTNTSHGCLNVSPSNAIWFYDNTKRGDIVEVVNTVGSTMSGTDGLGDWNIPWDQWVAKSALKVAPTPSATISRQAMSSSTVRPARSAAANSVPASAIGDLSVGLTRPS